MKKNMGNIDRVVRFVIAILFSTLYFLGYISGTIGLILLVVSVVFALTSIISFCPLYAVFGMKTCAVDDVD
ncbi:MAG: DUF2892 domain-containing protein [Cyclobacteriaceae bacterium]